MLERAVRNVEILSVAREKHKVEIDKIKEQRNKLLISMTEHQDGSPAQAAIERQVDELDYQELRLHTSMKDLLLKVEPATTEIIQTITEAKFGPSANSATTATGEDEGEWAVPDADS